MDGPLLASNPVANTITPASTEAAAATTATASSSLTDTCSSNSNNNTVLELQPAPGWLRYRSRAQQLISFSFSPTLHLLCITCVLSISKFCNAAALNASLVTASAPSPSLIIANLTATLGPQLDKLKSFAPAAANSINPSSSNSFGSSIFAGKSILDMVDFVPLNVSGKRNTSLDICKYCSRVTRIQYSNAKNRQELKLIIISLELFRKLSLGLFRSFCFYIFPVYTYAKQLACVYPTVHECVCVL